MSVITEQALRVKLATRQIEAGSVLKLNPGTIATPSALAFARENSIQLQVDQGIGTKTGPVDPISEPDRPLEMTRQEKSREELQEDLFDLVDRIQSAQDYLGENLADRLLSSASRVNYRLFEVVAEPKIVYIRDVNVMREVLKTLSFTRNPKSLILARLFIACLNYYESLGDRLDAKLAVYDMLEDLQKEIRTVR